MHEGCDHRTQRDDPAELSDDFLFADVRLECLLRGNTEQERKGKERGNKTISSCPSFLFCPFCPSCLSSPSSPSCLSCLSFLSSPSSLSSPSFSLPSSSFSPLSSSPSPPFLSSPSPPFLFVSTIHDFIADLLPAHEAVARVFDVPSLAYPSLLQAHSTLFQLYCWEGGNSSSQS